ncbi:MAG: DNA translocase FtsK 4TM domain-containing protein [Pirellulales bacterium]|nr:DNA translocase FtsK 4TM domain-containing protein [Pirellulales bacterium]
MFEERSVKIDLVALALLALVIFLGLSLITYNAFDPPSTVVWPATGEIRNACGRAGAMVAHFLFESLGIGAYYLAASLGVLTYFLLRRREIDQPIIRSLGWVISAIGLATLAALAIPNWTPGPIIGAGGYIGAMARSLLESHFALAGAYILTLSVFLAGLLLATDYFVFRAAAVTTTVAGRSMLQVGHFGHVVRKRARLKTDLDTLDELAAEEDEELASADDEECDEDEAEEAEDEAEEKPRSIRVRTQREASGKNEKEPKAPAEESEVNSSGAAAKLASGIRAALGLGGRTVATPAATGAAAVPVIKPKTEREALIEQLEAADLTAEETDYELPPLELLLPNEDVCHEEQEKEVRRKAKTLEKTFKDFGFNIRVVEIETGPVIAQFEVELEAGLRLSKITGLADDLAIALRVPSVRIVAPIPGKNTVGIEVPNENRQLVRLREVIEETNGKAKRMKIPVYLGKDVSGNPLVVDLTTLPHLLIAGRTGTGKSVCLNTIIVSMLMTRGPDEVRMLMIDPKMVELSGYRKLPHLMHPVVTDMRKAEAILAWAVDKMEERYQLLSRAGVRHLSVYNQLGDDELRDRIRPESEDEWRQIPRHLPYIVIVADEMADLMMTAGKDVEQHIIRLAQKSRAVGIHLILATQKPTVDVITGLIKSNLPARIAFQVASRTDSRVVLDEMGADKLLGNGDMLYLSPGTSTMLRGQGTFLSDDEITRVVDFVGVDDPQFAGELMQLKTKDELEAAASGGGNFQSRDDLYDAAVDIVVRERRGSCSLLQRALGIGYGRAARLIDFMAEDGVVGQYNGAQAREVLISLEDWESRNAQNESPTAGTAGGATKPRPAMTSPERVDASSVKPVRRNKIIPDPEEPSELEDELEEQDDTFEENAEDYDSETDEQAPFEDEEESGYDADQWAEVDEADLDSDDEADDEWEESDESDEEESDEEDEVGDDPDEEEGEYDEYEEEDEDEEADAATRK